MPDLYRLAWPLVRQLDPETAHGLALAALKRGLVPAPAVVDPPGLATRVLGLDFANPVCLAAGFDKNAEAVAALLALGFGAVEIGSVTPRPQPGNPRPRLFRLEADEAVINRMGFNNDGLEAVAERLAARPRRGIVGANLGKNKDTADAADDYVKGVRALAPLADYLVINVSSPNTPGLRALQDRAQLDGLVGRVREELDRTATKRPLLLKIAPDLAEEDLADIAEVALAGGLDGLIVSNTTIARPASLTSSQRHETGGLSGRPLMAPSTAMLARLWQLTGGRLPLVGVGGVFSGRDAYAKIRAGASLVQVYTAMIYRGPAIAAHIKRELAQCLAADGFATVAAAVGADHRSS